MNKIKEVRLRVVCGECGRDNWFHSEDGEGTVSVRKKKMCIYCGSEIECFVTLRQDTSMPDRLYG